MSKMFLFMTPFMNKKRFNLCGFGLGGVLFRDRVFLKLRVLLLALK